MNDHSEKTPPFPNGSIDMNALHNAAVAGTLTAEMPDEIMLVPESGSIAVPAAMAPAAVEEPVASVSSIYSSHDYNPA
jgi:hypothetical protein